MPSLAAQPDPASDTHAANAGDDRSSVRLILTALAAAVAAFGLFGAVGLKRFLKQPTPTLAAATTVDAAPLMRGASPVAVQRLRARPLRRPGNTRSAKSPRRSVGTTPTASAVPGLPSDPSQGEAGPGSSPPAPGPSAPAAPGAGAPAPVAEPQAPSTPPPPVLSIDLPPVVEIDVPALPAVPELPLPPVSVPALPPVQLPSLPTITTPVLP